MGHDGSASSFPFDMETMLISSIAATGGIVRTMTRDLLIDPKTRGVDDIVHVITAAASSSSKDSATQFVRDCVAPFQDQEVSCSAYGSYEELVKDPNVDIIYVGSPHSHHYQNCMLALQKGKPTLCEKPMTVNAAQAKALTEEAKKRNLFFMEATWTRFFPLSIAVRKRIKNGDIGEVLRVSADLSTGEAPEIYDEGYRNVNKDLAGGALLDLGAYSLLWLFQTVYHTMPKDKRKPPKLVGTAMTPEPRTGADESTTMLLDFPVSTPTGSRSTHGIATTAMRVHFDPGRDSESASPAVRIQGDKGEIQVFGPIYRPARVRIVYTDTSKPIEIHAFDFPGGTHGMSWEGDEAARCLLAGKLESEGIPWEESIAIMEVMDEARRQGDLKYPEVIETTEYPVDMKSRDPNAKRELINRN